MKNTLTDLSNYLFEQIEVINDYSLSESDLDKELKRLEGIAKVADKIIQIGQLQYKVMKHIDEFGADENAPRLIGGK